MERFSKEIIIGKQKRVFQFTRMRNKIGVKFFITSQDENNNAISFSLVQKDTDEWKLIPGSARWLYNIESELSDAIVDTRLQ
jgi:hypothetical protein